LLYFGDIVGNVYAVDARSGALAWRVRADDNPNATITGTPTLHGNTLFVPVSSLEGVRPIDPQYECCKFRGSVVAYDAASGAVKWRTYMTDPPRVVGTNAKGAKQYGPSGVPVWSSPAIDEKRGRLYIGTGENYSSPTTEKSDAVLALDLATGAIEWVFQGTAGDAENLACFAEDKTNCPRENGPDFDFGAGVVLASLPDGRALVIGGEKSGAVYALDPDTGKLVWQAKPGRGGTLGGVHFGMAANSDSVFVPINDAADGRSYTDKAQPGVFAFDLATGKRVWSAPSNTTGCTDPATCGIGYSQAITATQDLVFAGSVDGWLRILDAQSGAVLWQIDSKTPAKTVTGTDVGGGSFGGGAGPVLYHGMLFASSGYSVGGTKPGNLLLAFEAR
jgi:polyvinyl alcohol dehydrogenase (cytochrome)